MRTTRAGFFPIALCLALANSICADGCMFSIEQVGRAGALVESPRQEALMVVGPEDVRVMLRTQFRAGPTDLAWFIPVPARPVDILPGDDATLDSLNKLTAPTFYRVTHGGGMNCGCAAEGPTTMPIGSGVAVWETGKAGIFDFTVLEAASTEDLIQWLRDHRARIPDNAAAAFAPYVQRRWHWLVLRVRPEASDQKTLAPHPITFRYATRSPVFPLIISAPFAAAENDVVLYILSDGRCTTGNWDNRDLPEHGITTDPNSASGTTYERWFKGVTSKHTFITEFARPLNDDDTARPALTQFAAPIEGERKLLYLTRLRTLATRENLDRDIQIVPSPAPAISNDIYVTDELGNPNRSAFPFLAGSAIVGGMRLRRRRSLRTAGLGLILIGLVFAVAL